MWPANLITKVTLFTFGMHITNLNYLKNRFFNFIKLLDASTEELNRTLKGLDNAATIPDNNNRHLPDLSNLEAQ